VFEESVSAYIAQFSIALPIPNSFSYYSIFKAVFHAPAVRLETHENGD
jgi:hypothetical protein